MHKPILCYIILPVIFIVLSNDGVCQKVILESNDSFTTAHIGTYNVPYTKYKSSQIDKVRKGAAHWIENGTLYLTSDGKFFKGDQPASREDIAPFGEFNIRDVEVVRRPIEVLTLKNEITKHALSAVDKYVMDYQIRLGWSETPIEFERLPSSIMITTFGRRVIASNLHRAGDLSLVDVTLYDSLIMKSCTITGSLIISRMHASKAIVLDSVHIAGNIVLSSSVIRSLDISNCVIDGAVIVTRDTMGIYDHKTVPHLTLTKSTIKDSVSIYSSLVRSYMSINNCGCKKLCITHSVFNKPVCIESCTIAVKSNIDQSAFEDTLTIYVESFAEGMDLRNRKKLTATRLVVHPDDINALTDKINPYDIRSASIMLLVADEGSKEYRIGEVEQFYQYYLSYYRSKNDKESVDRVKYIMREWRGEYRHAAHDIIDKYLTEYGKNTPRAALVMLMIVVLYTILASNYQQYLLVSNLFVRPKWNVGHVGRIRIYSVMFMFYAWVHLRIRWKGEWHSLDGGIMPLMLIVLWASGKIIIGFVLFKAAIDIPIFEVVTSLL